MNIKITTSYRSSGEFEANLTCPECGYEFKEKLSTSQAKQEITCPNCGITFSVNFNDGKSLEDQITDMLKKSGL